MHYVFFKFKFTENKFLKKFAVLLALLLFTAGFAQIRKLDDPNYRSQTVGQHRDAVHHALPTEL